MKNLTTMTPKLASLIILILFSCGNVECWRSNISRRNNGSSRSGFVKPRVCSTPRLPNGSVMPMFKAKMMRFSCNKDFIRYGDEYAECLNGRWSIRTFPICIKAGCPLIHPEPDNGKIIYLNSKASALLFCEPNFESIGSIYSHCNGTSWDRAIGTCRETDNAPMTFCDFESESICGWQHDSDHDTDFQRHSGYNNKTLTIHTGPQADHSTGVPLQGHYMVIYTNSEVSTKRARLLSPLYNFPSAQQLCFKFYYFMHGSAVGTLRVYAKPESVEMQDILQDDMEIEAKSEFIIFQIQGSQGNSWIEGGGSIKVSNESFQIIIEAVSGQTRISDIAFDDFSLLIDDECSESDESGTKSPPVTDANAADDDALTVDSCVGRCFEDVNISVHLNANNRSLSCSCSLSCHLGSTCCPDFIDVCINATMPTTTISTTTLTQTTKTSKQGTTTTTQIPVVNTTTSTLPKFTNSKTYSKSRLTTKSFLITTSTPAIKIPSTTFSTSTSTTKPTTKTSTASSTTRRMKTTTAKINQTLTKASDDYEEVQGEDEHAVSAPEIASDVPLTIHETDKMTMPKSEGNFLITAAILSVCALVTLILFSIFLIRRYREASNPLNYKESGNDKHRSTKNANEEFSEIRYLTSDETLDFTLISDENL